MKYIIISSFFLTLFPAFAQTIALDPAFGNAGIAITPGMSETTRFALAPDGSIFSCGYQLESGGTGIYHLTVTKHLGNGTLDSNFGTNGITTTSIDYSEYPLDIQVQPDGKVLVSGSSYLGPTQSGPGDYHAFTVRYTASGDLDNSFGTNGIFKLPYTDSHTASIVPLSDGSFILAGNGNGYGTLTKINSTGAVDNQFGMNGTLFLADLNFAFILWNSILLSDNSILCTGYDMTDFENTKVSFCKLDLNGNYVTSFGQNGKVVMDLHSSPGGMPEMTEFISHAVETSDHKIILAGTAGSTLFMRVLPDGTPDPSFGTNGIITNSLPFSDFTLQNDDKILVAGSKTLSTYNYGYSISRLDQQGTIDASFNGSGTFDLDLSTENDHVQCIKLSGTKIIAGGSSNITPETSATLVRLDYAQNLGLNETSSPEISVYPNPFKDELTISTGQTLFANIQLTDAAGRVIQSLQPDTDLKISVAHLAAGMYQLVFTGQEGEHTIRKLIKH